MLNKTLSTEFVPAVSHVTHTRLSTFITHTGDCSSVTGPKNTRRHQMAKEHQGLLQEMAITFKGFSRRK